MAPTIVKLPIIRDTANSYPRGYVTFEITEEGVTIHIEDEGRDVTVERAQFSDLAVFLK